MLAIREQPCLPAAPSSVLAFASAAYARAIPHLGRPVIAAGLPPLFSRAIAGSAATDLVGPWPYTDAPEVEGLSQHLGQLAKAGFVSLALTVRPDSGLVPRDRGLFRLNPLKPHFIFDPQAPPLVLSRKARRNLAIAERRLTVKVSRGRSRDVEDAAIGLQLQLAERRSLSGFARVRSDHFGTLLGMPQCRWISVADAEGIVGVLVAIAGTSEMHCVHLLVHQRGIRACAGYLLLSAAVETWGRSGRIYFGGAPAGADGPGIARFKVRWANRVSPALLLTAILRPDEYDRLAMATGTASSPYFPAYREIRPSVLVATRQDA